MVLFRYTEISNLGGSTLPNSIPELVGQPFDIPTQHIVKAIDITDICSEKRTITSVILCYAWITGEFLVINVRLSRSLGIMFTRRQIEENSVEPVLSQIAKDCGLTAETLSRSILENAPELQQ